MNPNPIIPQIHDQYELSEYDRDLNAQLYKELKELRKEMNLRVGDTYTPVLTNTTNVAASTAHLCRFMRLGNVVLVSGIVDIDPTAAASSVLDMSLPIACDITSAYQLSGVFAGFGAGGDAGSIVGNTGDFARFLWTAADLTNHSFGFNFTYQLVA